MTMTELVTMRHDVPVTSLAGIDAITVDLFKAAFRNHPLGVAVVTADPGDGPVAMTVSSLSSVSASPPVVSFSSSAASSSAPALERADSVVIHMLGAAELPLAKLGATSGIDRFADASSWYRLPTGEPVFRVARSWMRASVVHRVGVGGSVVYLGHVVEAVVDTEPSEPLVYHDRTWHRLGKRSALA